MILAFATFLGSLFATYLDKSCTLYNLYIEQLVDCTTCKLYNKQLYTFLGSLFATYLDKSHTVRQETEDHEEMVDVVEIKSSRHWYREVWITQRLGGMC